MQPNYENMAQIQFIWDFFVNCLQIGLLIGAACFDYPKQLEFTMLAIYFWITCRVIMLCLSCFVCLPTNENYQILRPIEVITNMYLSLILFLLLADLEKCWMMKIAIFTTCIFDCWKCINLTWSDCVLIRINIDIVDEWTGVPRRFPNEERKRDYPIKSFCKQLHFSYDVCPICLDVFVENEPVKILPCEHFFHSDCIDLWLTNHSNCPFCKSSC